MAQISTIGVGQDYTSVALWAATEGAVDNGVGNPAIGEITGNLTESVTINGTFIRGYILRAQAGEEFDPETLTGASVSGNVTPNSSTVISCEINDLRLLGGVRFLGNATYLLNNCLAENSGGNAVDGSSRTVTAKGILTTNCSRGFESSSASVNRQAINCTSIDVTGSFSFVRWAFTNCLHLGTGSGFAATDASSDYNASDDTSSPGANSLDNRTIADVVNFAGSDFRTAAASALATAGDGTNEDYIGFALEVSGGISVTGTAIPTQTEADVVAGGKTIILTLSGDTWVAAGTGPIGSTADTQAIIDGLTSAQSETFGWNNEVRDKEVTTAVVRTSSTVATITLTASASYDITATETITATIPAAVLVTSATPVVATPTFTVTAVVSGFQAAWAIHANKLINMVQ